MTISEKYQANFATNSMAFKPFILIDGHFRALVMSHQAMAFKSHVFAERSREGWTGNGDDWTSIAQIIVADQIAIFAEKITYDSDADMFSARGTRPALEKLGFELQAIFQNDEAIRELMSRIKVNL